MARRGGILAPLPGLDRHPPKPKCVNHFSENLDSQLNSAHKTRFSPAAWIIICLVAILGLSIYFLQVWMNTSVVQQSENRTASNTNSLAKTSRVATEQPGELFKVVIDLKTGQYAAVSSDKETVSLKDSVGNIIWTTNIIKAASKYSRFGGGEIWAMQLSGSNLYVNVGNATFGIDKLTGKITTWAQD